MTTFRRTVRVLWRPKWRIANWMLLAYGLLVVGNLVQTGFSEGWSRVNLMNITTGVGVGLGVIAFVWLAVRTEHDWVQDTYRLLPVTNTRFYLAGVATTVGAYLYFVAVRLLVMGLSALVSGQQSAANLSHWLRVAWTGGVREFGTVGWLGVLAFVVLLVSLLIVGAWVLITLVHLLTNALSTFLPAGRQRIFKGLLAIVVIGVLVWLGKWLAQLRDWVTAAWNDAAMVSILGMFVIGVVAMMAVNVYLLKFWVEARVR